MSTRIIYRTYTDQLDRANLKIIFLKFCKFQIDNDLKAIRVISIALAV